jgi:glucose-1-phosphatase
VGIQNIIFDLGGVLLNIDYQRSIQAFMLLGLKDFTSFFTQAAQVKLFDHFDKGQISARDFRNELIRISGLSIKDEEIDSAWNAMLLDFPAERLTLLEGVRRQYRIFLLSNTNAIHYPAYMSYMKKTFGMEDLSGLFEKQYLSNRIGMRKPDLDVYEHILRENRLKASESLFIDDSAQHVEGARKAGLHALWLDTEKQQITDFFNPDSFRLNQLRL